MKDREILLLTQQLEVTNKELQDTKQQEIDVTRALQEDLTKERHIQQLQQEKEVNQASLQLQLRTHQRQLHDSQERERALRQQLQNTSSTLQQTQQTNVTLQQRVQQVQEQCATLQQRVQQLQEQSHWVVMREEIEMTKEVLGKGVGEKSR